MKVAILGHGNVGGALARAFSRAGVEVTIAASDDRKDMMPSWVAENKISTSHLEEAVLQNEALVLAIPFSAVEKVLPPLRDALRGKVVIDCTNPVSPSLSHGLSSMRSGSEYIQSLLPESHVAKCFSIYGFENLEQPPANPVAPAMLIAADHPDALMLAKELARRTDWVPVHVGPLTQALHLEHLTLLWISMVRVHGMSPRSVWALVQD